MGQSPWWLDCGRSGRRAVDRRLADVADDLARHDSDRLLANGRFLAEKFGTSSLAIPDATAATVSQSVPASEVVPADGVQEGERIDERERVH